MRFRDDSFIAHYKMSLCFTDHMLLNSLLPIDNSLLSSFALSSCPFTLQIPTILFSQTDTDLNKFKACVL